MMSEFVHGAACGRVEILGPEFSGHCCGLYAKDCAEELPTSFEDGEDSRVLFEPPLVLAEQVSFWGAICEVRATVAVANEP